MSSPPPTKPPRGVKQGKETSGLLMSVIRTLSASETNEQREKERAKLEKEYKKSDARLDELVAENAQEIMEVMQKFSAVSGALTSWGQHCDAAVARLAACRSLLRLRRDDLRRLWMDARTHHYALNMLTDIERVVVSEREAREAASAGRVLCAAGTLRSALDAADSTLAHVTALSTTRLHLQAKKQELVQVIVSLVSAAVYRGEPAPLARTASARRRAALLLAELTKSEEVTDAYLQDITPEFEASLTEEDKTFETTVMISLEALGVLEQLNEATEKFKCQIQNELLEVIDTVSRRIIDDGDVDVEAEPEYEQDEDIQENEGVTETGRPLARLIACLGEEFRAIGARNKRLLQLWRAALQKHKMSDTLLHTEQHYWSAVQQVLQLLLSEYLEIDAVSGGAVGGETRAAPPTPELRLSDYFAKKRPTRRKDKLFKLAPRLCAGGAARAARWARVCPPRAALLPAALPALHSLAADIEAITGGGACSLRVFVTDYVVWGESARLGGAARAAVDAASRDPRAWRELVQLPDTHDQSPVCVFSCVVAWWRSAAAAARGARACGACGGEAAARAALGALAAAGAAALAAHSRLLPARARAARWLADDDIVRFLQALPNWTLLKDPDAVVTKQELKDAYEREAEILGTSLGDGAITNNEIVEDINTLVDLAVMSESMYWFSEKIKSLPSIISAPTSTGSSIKPPESEITSSAKIFEKISQKCLLFLHLEMRIQCFYYLGQEGGVGAGGGVGGEGGGARGAARLAAALGAAHERATLRPRAARYVFAGLAEMMSAAVVWRWQGCGAGAGAGAWLGTLRHCLAALALPHDGLHRAQAYLHLLNCTVEEIIQSIRERGSQFSELEYLNAFKVIGARQGLSPADMRSQLQKLSAALGHVGVTV